MGSLYRGANEVPATAPSDSRCTRDYGRNQDRCWTSRYVKACPTPAVRVRGRDPATAGVRQPLTAVEIQRKYVPLFEQLHDLQAAMWDAAKSKLSVHKRNRL